MPFLALLEADLIGMVRSWVVRIWLLLMAFQSVLTIAEALNEGTPAIAIANLLGTFLVIWSTVVIVISSGAVSSEAGVVADSILSKAVTRYEYILAKMSARLVTVLGIYLAVVLPPILIILQNTEEDLSRAGIAWSVVIVGTFLVLLTNLAVTCSTIFNRTLVAMVVVWVIWYMSGFLLSLLGGDYLSPAYIIDNLPLVLAGDYERSDQLRTVVSFSVPSIGAVTVAAVHFARKDL